MKAQCNVFSLVFNEVHSRDYALFVLLSFFKNKTFLCTLSGKKTHWQEF